ncbi:uncharacterized protein LOC128224502 [Mya arenaria]|uniref:uncharacterized protein LOC128224502 n=1 Tax=Mya arenaria TaxID=6604 RepID=UPI0022DF835D|nr:uncharacterized protein LOC128224502 [Mya arenaria]XP_052790313.1 uncharacterized protein LOC128224502 [Mya arenaria]XP_052790314.1 uncharacterized protein LOC128224502 [Mya arenaria]
MPCFLCASDWKDARVLPECHHALCEDCLTKHITASFEKKIKKRKKKNLILTCPKCTTQFQGPDSRTCISEWMGKLRVISCKPSVINVTNTDSTSEHEKASMCEKTNSPERPCRHSVPVENQVSGKTSNRRTHLSASDDCYTFCSTHVSKNVEFYCGNHEEFICRLCIIRDMNHRQCDHIIDLEDASKIIQRGEIHKTVLGDLKAVIEHYGALIGEIDEARKESENQRVQIVSTFETVRQKALQVIDNHEKTCLKTFDQAMDNQAKRLNESKGKIKARIEETKLIVAEFIDMTEVEEKRVCLFSTVFKILRNYDNKKTDRWENHMQCKIAKLNIQNTEASNPDKVVDDINIAFEDQQKTLSPYPFFQATTESVLRLVSLDIQVNPKTIQCVQVATRDGQTNDEVKQQKLSQSKVEQHETNRDVDKTKPTVKKPETKVVELETEPLKERHKHNRHNMKVDGKDEVAKGVASPYTRYCKTIKPYKCSSTPVLRRDTSTTLMFPNKNYGWISDVIVLKNGQIVFSEAFHNRLVITENDFSFVSECDIDTSPGHMIIRDNGSILVCKKATNKLLVVNMQEDAVLTVESYVTTPWHPKSIQSLPNGDVLISMQGRDSKWKLSKLQLHDDDTFKSIKNVSIPIDDGYSLHVVVSQTGTEMLVIQCCETEGVVHGCDLDGNEKFSYECDQPEAATHDKYGFIYVVGFTGEVHILKPDGTPLGVNYISNMYKCKRIAYDESNDRLIITTYKDKKLHLLKIDYINE